MGGEYGMRDSNAPHTLHPFAIVSVRLLLWPNLHTSTTAIIKNTIKVSIPICFVQKKNKPRTSLRSSRTARCNGLGIAGRTL